MAYFYTYIDPAEIEAQFMKADDEDDKSKQEKAEVEMVKRDSVSSDDESKQTRIWTTDICNIPISKVWYQHMKDNVRVNVWMCAFLFLLLH